MAGALGGLREGLINGQRTGRVRRPSAWRDECRTAALLTICGFKRLRQQLMLYNLKILKSSAGSSTARKPFQKASETRTARVSVSMLQRAACRRRTSGPAHMHGVVCTGRACPVSCVHAIPVSMPSRGLRHEREQRGRREREWSAQRRGRGSGGQRERGRRRSRRRHQEEEVHGKDRRVPSLNNNGRMANDRAGPARHEDPALRSRERELNPVLGILSLPLRPPFPTPLATGVFGCAGLGTCVVSTN